MFDGPLCDFDECPHFGQIQSPLDVTCPMCKEPLFCTRQCMLRGLCAHFSDQCTKREEIQAEMDKREYMTPRSVLNRIFVIVDQDVPLQKELFRMERNWQRDAGESGCLVIRATSAQDVCTLINGTHDRRRIIINMVMWQSCSQLMHDPTMESAWQLRLLVPPNGFVLSVCTQDCVAVLSKLYLVESPRISQSGTSPIDAHHEGD
jgi:hypothetical protein